MQGAARRVRALSVIEVVVTLAIVGFAAAAGWVALGGAQSAAEESIAASEAEAVLRTVAADLTLLAASDALTDRPEVAAAFAAVDVDPVEGGGEGRSWFEFDPQPGGGPDLLIHVPVGRDRYTVRFPAPVDVRARAESVEPFAVGEQPPPPG